DGQRKRLQLIRSFYLGNGLIQTSHRREVDKTVPMMCGRVSRLEFKGALEFPFAQRPIPIVATEAIRERGVSFSQRVVNLESLLRSLACFRKRFLRRKRRNAKTAKHDVRVRQTYVGERIS